MGRPFVWRRPVAFGDVDWARILYYPRLFHYCHQAFEALMGEVTGGHYAVFLSERGLGCPAVHVEADYVRPVPYGTDLEIEVRVLALGRKSITFGYRARCGEPPEPCAEARVTTVLVDMESFRSVVVPDWLRDGLEPFLDA